MRIASTRGQQRIKSNWKEYMTQPNILALETATDACSVALMVNGALFSCYELAPKQHTHRIFPMIDTLLAQANLKLNAIDCLAVGKGPGSFTGVRLGISLAQGLAFGLKLPLFGVSTLEALAYQIRENNHHIIPALDARMGEVYTGVYQVQDQALVLMEREQVGSPQTLFHFTEKYPQAVAIGSGWETYYPTHDALARERHPHALDIAKIVATRWQKGEKGAPANALKPTYLRNDVAKKAQPFHSLT